MTTKGARTIDGGRLRIETKWNLPGGLQMDNSCYSDVQLMVQPTGFLLHFSADWNRT